MSSLHSASDGRTYHSRHCERDVGGALTLPGDTSTVDIDVLQRIASLSLSRLPAESHFDADEESSQAGTDVVSTFTSPPRSPVSESDTSFDFERTSSSDQLSSLSPQPSLYSLTDSLKDQAIRLEHGRGVNTHSDIYKLAADDRESARLDKQHRLYTAVLGDYVPPFREILEDNGDTLNPKTCLDIGCGAGTWILEVAATFPHVSCTAVDLIPLPAMTQIPSNLRFEIDDVSLGLEHFAGDFDVVHVRLLSSGIRDYYRLINDTALALRPRGLAVFTENDWRVYDSEKRPIVPTTSEIWGAVDPPEGWTGTGMARSGSRPVRSVPKATVAPERSSFVARFLTLARQAVHKRGGHVDAAALLQRWISEHREYEDVVSREVWIPIGQWPCDMQKHPLVSAMTKEELEELRWVGKEADENMIEFMRSGRPLLLSTGVPEQVVNTLTEKATEEIREGRSRLLVCIQNVYARKKGSPERLKPTTQTA